MKNFIDTSIDGQHRAEFKASEISDDIAALNFRTWNPLDENDLDEVFTLLVLEPEHRNNGTLAGRSQNYLANTLRSGGWIFEGHLGVSVKPDSPRKSAEGKVLNMSSPGVQGINSYSSPASRCGWQRRSLGNWEWFGISIPYSRQQPRI